MKHRWSVHLARNKGAFFLHLYQSSTLSHCRLCFPPKYCRHTNTPLILYISITRSSHLLGFFLSSPMLFILSCRPLPDLPLCWSRLIAVPLIIPSPFWQAFHEENAVLLDLKGLRDLATLFSAVSGALVPAGAILQQLRLKRTAGRRHLPGEPSREVRCLNLK